MRTGGLLGCATLVLALGGLSLAPGAGRAGALRDENVLTAIPAGFVVGFTASQGPMTIVEYVPRGESVHDWSRMVTVQIHRGLLRVDPEAFAASVGRRWIGSCAEGQVVKVTSGTENGFRFTVSLMACPLNPGTRKPENAYTKVISGNDALYDIQYAYRSELDPTKITPAMKYLKSVVACDTRRPDRACPAGLVNARPPPLRPRRP